MAQSNSTFSKAFLPGLVIGLIVGGIAGAVLPELIAGPRIPSANAQTTGHVDTDRSHDEFGRDPGLKPLEDVQIPAQNPDGADLGDQMPEGDDANAGG